MKGHKTSCLPCNHGCSIGITLLRVITGVIPLLSGINKLSNLEMFQGYVQSMEVLGGMQGFVGTTLPWVEIILGAFLILGIFSRYAAAGMTLTFLLITITSGFMGNGGTLALHSYLIFTSLALVLMPTSCLSIEGLLRNKKSATIEKIKV